MRAARIAAILLAASFLMALASCCRDNITSAVSGVSSEKTTAADTSGAAETDTDDTDDTNETDETEDTMVITITVGGEAFTASLADTDAARAFAVLLPMTLDMSELNGNEKYCYLDVSLPVASSAPDMIHTGDIMLYGTSCVVVFYQDFPTSYSYTVIGHIDDAADLSDALGKGSVTVTFEESATK